jgi:hypothetical protein
MKNPLLAAMAPDICILLRAVAIGGFHSLGHGQVAAICCCVNCSARHSQRSVILTHHDYHRARVTIVGVPHPFAAFCSGGQTHDILYTPAQ